MEPYPAQREIIPCCVHLRTKTLYYMPDEMQAGPGHIKVTSTGNYWCNRTHEPVGPDDAPSKPHLCQAGRACYEPAE
jgi:hypothetical protein